MDPLPSPSYLEYLQEKEATFCLVNVEAEA